MKNIAVILAAGCGTRINSTLPKQFSIIEGVSIIEYSLKSFESHPLIDAIIIVGHSNYLTHINSLIHSFSKVLAVIEGGTTRRLSSYAALLFLTEQHYHDAYVIFHDAARPLVSHTIISDTIKALSHYEATTTAIKSTDTVLIASSQQGTTIETIPDRSLTYQMQTPQGFVLQKIKHAHDLTIHNSILDTATDDCALFHYAYPDSPIAIIEGSIHNSKITYEEDLDYLVYFLGKKCSC